MPSNVIIRACTVSEIEQSPTADKMMAAYADESSLKELGPAEADFAMYRNMEYAGVLHPIGAFVNGQAVGFALVFVYALPHYKGRKVATMESIFVLPEFRGYGTGAKLIRAAEIAARCFGAPALLVSSPHKGRLATALPMLGYRPSNDVFIKGLAA